MRAIEYECERNGEVSIRRSQEYESPVNGLMPEFWYLRRPLPACGEWRDVWKSGFRTLYWDGVRWWNHTPKQFNTPEAAFAEWQENIGSEN
jgi:hypothetical protein